MEDFKAYLKEHKAAVEAYLATAIACETEEYKGLYEAMNYSLLIGGKRIRPILTMIVLEALKVNYKAFMPAICAIECIHTYSLIHDDLPAMDNDDYRRGKLTNHKVYGEGQAILAGDGLLTAAFSLISDCESLSADQVRACVSVLARAAGPAGMVGGQSFDLASEGKHLPLAPLQILHRGKTGALFEAALDIGAILGHASAEQRAALNVYAKSLGLLFQITDDILDVTGTIEELGKTPGSDERQDKSTYVSLLGLDGAKEAAESAAASCRSALSQVGLEDSQLAQVVEYICGRTN